MIRAMRTLRATGLMALATMLGAAMAAPRFEDSMAQRLLACTACHGEHGRRDRLVVQAGRAERERVRGGDIGADVEAVGGQPGT